MISAYKRAIAVISFFALFAVHPVTQAEEKKPESAAQSGVAAQGTQDQSKDAKPAKADESKKKSADAEPECNN